MCTYQTEQVALRASAKTARGWTTMTSASVYYDHPVHLSAGHALLIDVRNPSEGADARVAIEMDALSARAFAETILRALDQVPVEILE
jgi:hypothetical protein